MITIYKALVYQKYTISKQLLYSYYIISQTAREPSEDPVYVDNINEQGHHGIVRFGHHWRT